MEKEINEWIKRQGGIHLKDVITYTLIVVISLLSIYLVSASMLITGKPWDNGMTANILNWIQLIALCVVILELDKIRDELILIRSGPKKK